MEIIDDFLVDKGKEKWVGILLRIKNKQLWIFQIPVHGNDIYFNSPNSSRGYDL